MPKDEVNLPSTLEKSTKKVQDTYADTLDSAEEQYDGDEARAHRTAWASVKHVAEKVGDHWELKDTYGPSDSRSQGSTAEKRAGKGDTAGGVDVIGNTRDQLVQRAKKAGVAGYSRMNKQQLGEALARKQG